MNKDISEHSLELLGSRMKMIRKLGYKLVLSESY